MRTLWGSQGIRQPMEPGECPGWASVGLVGCISGEHLNPVFLL